MRKLQLFLMESPMSAKPKELISHEEARMLLLEQRNEFFNQSMLRIEDSQKRLENILTDLNVSTLIMDMVIKNNILQTTIQNDLNGYMVNTRDLIDNRMIWILGVLGTAFFTLFGAIAHANHWI